MQGVRAETVLVDPGYCAESELEKLETLGVDGYVAVGREGRRAASVDATKHPCKARMAKKLATEEWDLVCLALNIKRMQKFATAR